VGHIAYRIDDELHRRAKTMAAAKGVTLKAWLEAAIREVVDRQEAEAGRRTR
jgi:predicted HicB family RNase H-like nuclease